MVLDDSRQAHWSEWKEVLKTSENLKLKQIQYKYFFNCITQCDRVNVDNFLIEDPEIVTIDSDQVDSISYLDRDTHEASAINQLPRDE